MKKKDNYITLLLFLIFLQGCPCCCTPPSATTGTPSTRPRPLPPTPKAWPALDNASYDAIWDAARQYNRNLLNRSNSFHLSEEQKAEYESLLDISGQGDHGAISRFPKLT